MADDLSMTRLERRRYSVVLYDDSFTIRIAFEDIKSVVEPKKKVITVKKTKHVSIDECYFSVRTYNALLTNGILWIEQLEGMTYAEFCKLKNLGERSKNEITNYMQRKGIWFKSER